MAAGARPLPQQPAPTGGGLDPALVRVIEALARADARRDYAAAQANALSPRERAESGEAANGVR